MQRPVVIVRDYRGKPLKRVALQGGDGRILISSERALAAVEAGLIPAIGCPQEDLFQFDPNKFDHLEKEWKENGRLSPEAWRGLAPYQN